MMMSARLRRFEGAGAAPLCGGSTCCPGAEAGDAGVVKELETLSRRDSGNFGGAAGAAKLNEGCLCRRHKGEA